MLVPSMLGLQVNMVQNHEKFRPATAVSVKEGRKEGYRLCFEWTSATGLALSRIPHAGRSWQRQADGKCVEIRLKKHS